MATDHEILNQCRYGPVSQVRALLFKNPQVDGVVIEHALAEEFNKPAAEKDFLQGLAKALIALLPSTYTLMKNLLSAKAPGRVFEVHFSIFGALSRSDFNGLEQEGLEYMLGQYLFDATSTAAYAAWKAGLVLAEDWLSPRSERLLIKLMAQAKYPAGRLGAINGYRFIVEHRRTFTEEEIRPMRITARKDKSEKVREQAQFHLDRFTGMRERELNDHHQSSWNV